MSLAVASACAAFMPAHAQDASGAATTTDQAAVTPQEGSTPSTPAGVQTVVVTGLRASLESSMALKRNATGFVDGIVAEDIGKFPDTNLAESLQRISGVSIDRTIGEGSKITVRGVGPDFNLVLLNGRQMPTSDLENRPGRAFDFANIASEGISQLQVYKSARAETPTGGIGATINVLTARPLSRPGLQATIGIKGVHDTSAENIPGDLQRGGKITPELSGLYSNTSADGRFGIGLSASYQERNLGYNVASVSNGWRGPFRGDENNWGTIPQPGTDGSERITNRPDPSDIYQVPQNLNYAMNGIQRQRTNGQLVFQFAPTKAFTTTLDYTYSENKVQTRRNDVSAWFNFGPSSSSWTDGPIAGPLVYTELIPNGTSDIAMGAADYATKSENKSLGFNAAWRVNSDLRLEVDAHRSTAESKPDSPFGSSNVLGTASFSRGDTSVDFSKDFPVLSIKGADFARAPQQVTGSVFMNGYVKSEVKQLQTHASLKMLEASELKFGVAHTDVHNRSAFSVQQRDTWGGATVPSDYPASYFHRESLRQYFDNIDGSDNPNLFNTFYTFNFDAVRQLAAKASGRPDLYLPKSTYDTDQRTREKSKSLYLQFNTDWDTALPLHTSVGVRYEKTDITSTALVPTATAITWVSQNEFPVTFGQPNFTTLTGKYHHLLPSFDADLDLRSDMKARFSYGETIGRARYDQLTGGQVLNTLARVNGGTGFQGNPGLLPVKSKNIDLAYEWYYGKSSFLSLGHFRKSLENYAGQSKIIATPFNLRTPVGGAYWNAALANGCANADTTCIRNYIFRNFAGRPGVARGPDDVNGNATGVITGQPNDPLAQFEITTFSNQKAARLRGLEFNVQHMFGASGFGVSANYTYVNSGLKFDNRSMGEQFALVGLSDSANLVGIFENDKWNVRAAYNWRDKFLAGTFDGSGPNPNYVEAYGQLDLSVGYNISKNLSLQFEAINLTDEIKRIHGRTERNLLFVEQSGPRYMMAARYKF
ncbi:TonB-dependent receptor [Massilia sp. MS-15]|uniref:TonB-dependent receptor n=1 Tax=Massilia sp. MS-15 TaxID=2878200 RepID=UPI001CD2E1ED|nr:TonB-dependent receptor [Massilia sp. MS-15]MCA1245531.1 TonB-dependent receptor [Massilia sp. MS-15]